MARNASWLRLLLKKWVRSSFQGPKPIGNPKKHPSLRYKKMWKIAFSGFSEIPSLKFPWNSSFNDMVRLQWCTFCVFYAYTSHLVAIKKFGLLGLAKYCSKQGQIWPTDHYFTVVCGQITMKTFFAMIGLSVDSLVSFWCLGLKELKFGQSTGQICPRNAQGGINLTLMHC